MKRLLFSFLFVLTAIAGWAQTTFTQGDFTYTVTDEDAKTVSIAKAEAATLTGALVIPTSVTESGETYAVTSIAENAFQGQSITSVTIPSSIISIDGWAFRDCYSLANIRIEDSENPLSMVDGYWSPFSAYNAYAYIAERNVYIGRNLTLSETTSVFDGITSVEFGPNVTTINSHLFYQAAKLSSVTIGNGVTTIGDFAFQEAGTSVEEMVVTMGNGVTSIGENAFYSCSHLKAVTLPSSLTEIKAYAFQSTGLTRITIPASVTNIREWAFRDCYSLANIRIEDSSNALSIIGGYYTPFSAYNANIYITERNVYIGRNLTLSETSSVFDGITSVEFGPNVTTISQSMFYQATNLSSATIGSGVTTIGDQAFLGCSKLTSVNIREGVTRIGEQAFHSTGLTSVTIPASVMTIGNEAFNFINALESVTIVDSENPLTLENNYYGAFQNGDGGGINYYTRTIYIGRNIVNSTGRVRTDFDTAEDVIIGPKVTTINESMFDGCQHLRSVVIGDGVTSIGDNAFRNCGIFVGGEGHEEATVSKLTVTMGKNVKTIGDGAFLNCSKLTSIEIPNGVTRIGEQAFHSTGLTSVTIPASVMTIGNEAFNFINALESVTIADSETPLTLENNYYGAFQNGDGGGTYYIGRNIVNSTGRVRTDFDTAEDVIIGPKVTTINESMFDGCQHLRSVVIGDGVTSIGDNAFRNCGIFVGGEGHEEATVSKLTVTMGKNVKTIGDGAFLNCSKLTSIEIPNGVTRIGADAFNNSGLTSVTIPASVETIGNQAFNFINSLESVTIADGDTPLTLENNFYGAFQNGDAGGTHYTKKVYLGRNINNYNNRNRTEFDTVEELTVGPKVTTLRPYMFAGCYGLQSVDMTNATSLTSISEYAFADITGITSVKVPWLTPITINENVFASGAYSSAILFVPAGTKEAYAAASVWENFTNIDHWSTLVTLTASTHGSIVTAEATASNSTEQYRQPKEDAVVYTLTADEGYELTALTDNDAAVSPLPTLGEEQTRANTEGEEFVTLNASFTPITYNLTYTLNGGTATNPATYTIETTTFTLNNPTKAGYDFAGWKLNGVGDAMMTVTIAQGSTGHLSYTATWTPTVYNIVYTMDGGTATPANPTTYTIETETFTLNNPTKTGHTFKGWKLNGEGDAMMEVTIAQGSTGHLAYTATWQVNKYTITFDSNGGSAVDPITQDYGTTVTAPDDPTKPGCDFAGWTPELPETMPAENMTVTATWTELTYTVSITGTGVTADNMNPKYGDDVVITIAADEDRTLNTLTVNNVDVTAQVVNNQYTIHNVSSNITVVATFNSTKEYIILAQGVGTFSCAQDLNFTGSGLKAYIAAGYNKSSKVVLMVRVYDIPAGTGLYLKGEAGVTYKIPYSTSQAYYVNMLKANLTASSIAKTSGDMSNFLLNKVDGEYGFFAPSETATLGAQKAYLQVPTSFMSGSEEARAISIAFEDDETTTNISDFELFTNSNEHLYNLKGQRVEKAGRGLYIKNGKKVVIK